MELLTNDSVRTEVKAILARFVGRTGSPGLKWYLARKDGDFDAPGPGGGEGGPVVKAEALEGKPLVAIYLEEVRAQ